MSAHREFSGMRLACGVFGALAIAAFANDVSGSNLSFAVSWLGSLYAVVGLTVPIIVYNLMVLLGTLLAVNDGELLEGLSGALPPPPPSKESRERAAM